MATDTSNCTQIFRFNVHISIFSCINFTSIAHLHFYAYHSQMIFIDKINLGLTQFLFLKWQITSYKTDLPPLQLIILWLILGCTGSSHKPEWSWQFKRIRWEFHTVFSRNMSYWIKSVWNSGIENLWIFRYKWIII